MHPALSEAAMTTDAAGGSLWTEKPLSDGDGGSELADVREAREEVGMPEASLLETSLNKVEDPAMPDDVWWAGE